MADGRALTRRSFLTSAAAGAAWACWPAGRVLGANERVGMAVIGVGGMGGGHVKHMSSRQDASLVAVCDPDPGRTALKGLKTDHEIARHQDFRKVLEMKDVDAVIIATPNHWHAPIAIAACQAGKDVYVQKPVAHCIWESRQMVKAARQYKRIVQGGTQQRSDPYYAELRADLKSGKYGAIKMVHCLKHNNRDAIGKVAQEQPIPQGVDYNLWCGPAPMTPLMRKRFHYDWHWQWNWGDGEMGNWGPHVVDDLRNILEWDDVPEKMIAAGGRFVWDDNGETPNIHVALFERKGFKVVVDIRILNAKKGVNAASTYMRCRGHNIIVCENATVKVERGGGGAYDKNGEPIKKYRGDAGGGHEANFLKAVKSRKPEDLNCEVEVAHQSTMMCLLANIAYRVGKQATVEQVQEAMKDHQDALDTITSVVQQVKDNEGDFKALMLGPQLTFDPKAEKFSGNGADEANKYLRYEMRKEFAVPEEV
jgi:predicted dehydrogenase